jgi:DNA-binding CsgD family transcriptional regulator
MVIKSRKRTVKIPPEELIIKFFMEDPLPVVITRAKDGAYVAINNTAVKLMGLPRKKIIGRTSIELGFFSADLRKSLIHDIKNQGFANNIPGKININNKLGIYLLFRAFAIKIGKETFFVVIATDVANHKSSIGELSDDKIFKITRKDDKFIKEKLKHYQLTPRQQEIALLSAAGHSNNEIAGKLFISQHTVKDHHKEIFRIIGIHSRYELFPKLLNFL